VIHWNLVWALGFNVIMIPLAFFNQLNPTLGASAMACSSILVVLNSLRMTYAKLDESPPPPSLRVPNHAGSAVVAK
jgi:cation transport ATPase